MKMLILSTTLPYPTNLGTRIRIYNLLKRWVERHELTLISFIESKSEYQNAEFLSKLGIEVYAVEKPKRAKWQWAFMSLFSSKPYDVINIKKDEMYDLIRRIYERNTYDVVICNFLRMSQYLPPQLDAIKILDQHNVDSHVWQQVRSNDPQPWMRWFAKINGAKIQAYEKQQLRLFDGCISVSDEDFLRTREVAPPGLQQIVAPNGVDTEFFSPESIGTVEQENTLVFCGSMHLRMNIDAVLYFVNEIFPLIRKEVPDTRFLIVGREPSESILKLSRNQNIEVTGTVEDVRPYLAQAAVFVAPLRLGGGTKIKVLEAMSMGKAVVTTSIGSQGLKVKNGMDLIIQDDTIEFAKSVVYLLKNPTKRAALGRSARKTVVDHYTWLTTADIIERFIQELVCKRRSGVAQKR